MRGQRQHLKHRLDLKQKALENIRKVTENPIKSTELAHAEIRNNQQILNQAHQHQQQQINNGANHHSQPSTSSSSAVEGSSYFKMHIKKVPDANGMDDDSLDYLGYDQELFNALLLSDSQEATTTTRPKSSSQPVITLEELEELLPEGDEVLIAFKKKQESRNATKSKSSIAKKHSTTSNQQSVKLFGPQTRGISAHDANRIISKIKQMCQGTLLHKRRENTKQSSTTTLASACTNNKENPDQQYKVTLKNQFMVRHVSLSQEFTRLQIRDNKRKVAESFIKLEHITKIVPIAQQEIVASVGTGVECYGFYLITQNKKYEFVTFEKSDFECWMEGLNLLIENRNHLFSLKYNMRDHLTSVF
ncbi:hypothetical protein AKO1_002344, partial [Acrasis kona]